MRRSGFVWLIVISLLLHAAIFWPGPDPLQTGSTRQSPVLSVTLKPAEPAHKAGASVNDAPVPNFSETKELPTLPSATPVASKKRDSGREIKQPPIKAPIQTAFSGLPPAPTDGDNPPKIEAFSIGGYRLAIAAAAVRIHRQRRLPEPYSGIAIVEVRIGGLIRGAQVALSQTSGQRAVDEQALGLVRKAVIEVPLPDSLPDATIELPVEFGADDAG